VTDFVVGESVLVSELLSEYEALQIFFRAAEERGHAGPSVTVDDRGQAITHPDYCDRMGSPHVQAGAWAFCRRPSAEALGLPTGTDWIRDHCPSLMFSAGSPYLNTPHFYDQLYIQNFGSSEPELLIPMCSASPIAWSNDGSRICVLEERLGHLTDGTVMAKYLLWEYELALGSRRQITGFPAAERMDFVELTYSLDSRWIHMCEWRSGRNLLIRADDGLVIRLPVASPAVAWNPGSGPSMMTVMVTDPESGNLLVHDYDVSADELSRQTEVRSPTGLPLRVRELSMSVDGLALVTAPVGAPGLEQLQRGGIQVAAVIDLDNRTIEPALPVRYRTPEAGRRHTSPRWCDDKTMHRILRTTIADRLLETGGTLNCEPDAPLIAHDHLQRWLEILHGFNSAWQAGAMPLPQFAQDYAQLAISCAEIDPAATDKELSSLRARANREPVARATLAWIDNRRRRGTPLTAIGPAASVTAEEDPSTIVPGQHNAMVAALGKLIAADDRGQAVSAVRELLRCAQQAGQSPERIWDWFASLTAAALSRRQDELVARVGLGVLLWNGVYLRSDPVLGGLGLGPTPPAAELALLVNCFEACTHLPERTILGRDSSAIFDVEMTRKWCQGGLARLPLTDYLTNALRPAHRKTGAPVLSDPSTRRRKDTGGSRAMNTSKVFISYVREDSAVVDRIAEALRAHGAEAWLDRTHITPGQRWRRAIRDAISDGTYFVACFSPSYAQRDRTYMNEELRLAIEQLRMMPLDRRWFIPVILRPCQIPEFEIDAVETLKSLQYIDFSQDWDSAIKQLIDAVCPRQDMPGDA